MTATIECNASKKLPSFTSAGNVMDQEELYVAVIGWKEHYDAVMVAYEEIALIKTLKQMERYLRKTGNENHL